MQAITMCAHTSRRPFAPVVADVSLLHAGNQIGDAGLTQLAAALKINNAIQDLILGSKSGGCDVLYGVAACMVNNTIQDLYLGSNSGGCDALYVVAACML